MNKQNRNRLIDTENILMIAGGVCEKGEGMKKHRLVVTK